MNCVVSSTFTLDSYNGSNFDKNQPTKYKLIYFSRLVFLSDYLQFTTAEMKLNTKTFQWHAKMPEVFEEHSQIIKEKTMEYQKALKLRRERFIEELEAYNLQVDDFYTYGNVDKLQKYLKKAQTLNTKLALCRQVI